MVTLLVIGLITPQQASSKPRVDPECHDVRVPVTVPDTPDAEIYGKYCAPVDSEPETVHLLVPGSTATHEYWDWPDQPELYSYVRRAVDDGDATLSIDRIGSGQSTRPPSTTITLEVGADTLHDVITELRDGSVSGHPFSNVVYVGHSLGSIYGWVEASRHQDVDAFVLTAMTHEMKPSFLPIVSGTYYPAVQDPKFDDSGFDQGYLTTMPGTRPTQFYYTPATDPKVIQRDEENKDTVSSTEFGQAVGLISSPPPETAPSQAIQVPTLLVVGDRDPFFCGSPDGIECTKRSILQHESPYYGPEADLDVVVARFSGHSTQLHYTSPLTTERMLTWVDDALE